MRIERRLHQLEHRKGQPLSVRIFYINPLNAEPGVTPEQIESEISEFERENPDVLVVRIKYVKNWRGLS